MCDKCQPGSQVYLLVYLNLSNCIEIKQGKSALDCRAPSEFRPTVGEMGHIW